MKKGKNRGFLFILPGLLGFILFFIWPFAISLFYSVLDSGINGKFTGLSNYISLFQNKAYMTGFVNTGKFILMSLVIQLSLSMVVAMKIKKWSKYKSLLTMIFLIPLVVPSGSMVFFWKSFFGEFGMLNGWLQQFSIENIRWLESGMVFWVIIFIFLWKNMGYTVVLLLSGLENIPSHYYEAALMEGASGWFIFRKITLPSLMTTMIPVIILSIVNSFKVFKEIYLITGEYPHESIYMLQHFMNNMFHSLDYQKLTSAMIILVCIIAVVTYGLLRIERSTMGE